MRGIAARALVTVTATLVSGYALAVLFVPGAAAPFVTALRATMPLALMAHLSGGLVALAAGPWQFSARLRARAPQRHRWIGRTYIVAVLIGGAGAMALAPLSQEGAVTHAGFGLLAVLWLLCTLQGYRRIRSGDEVSHRAWMTRSFALTFAAVTLRILLPLQLASGIAFHDAYRIVSWLCWVPNLAVAEWLVRRARARVGTPIGV
jgi:uncharacterized membrane protein